MGFITMDRVPAEHAFHRETEICPVRVFPLILDTRISFIYHRHYITSATDNVVTFLSFPPSLPSTLLLYFLLNLVCDKTLSSFNYHEFRRFCAIVLPWQPFECHWTYLHNNTAKCDSCSLLVSPTYGTDTGILHYVSSAFLTSLHCA